MSRDLLFVVTYNEKHKKCNYTYFQYGDFEMKNGLSVNRVLLFILLVHISNIVSGGELVQPFGNISWEDGLYDVVQKINKLDGVESAEMFYSKSQSVSVLGIKSKDELDVALNSLLAKHVRPRIKRPVEHADKNNIRMRLNKYVKNDLDNKSEYIASNMSIIVKPIVISGVPFTYIINLRPSEWLYHAFPNNLMVESKTKIDFPMVIESAQIVTVSDTYEKRINELLDAVLSKLGKVSGKSYSKDSLSFGSASATDVNGNIMSFRDQEYRFDINYNRPKFWWRKYSEPYDLFKSELVRQSNANKKDYKDAL